MKAIRVTKYNPEFRNDKGYYLKEEWTSFSDVGQYYDGVLFDVEEYYKTENKYIEAILLFCKSHNVEMLKFIKLEKYEINDNANQSMQALFNDINSSTIIFLNDLPNLIRLALRECIWCELASIQENMEISFGYDYYMYFLSNYEMDDIIQGIKTIGLHVD